MLLCLGCFSKRFGLGFNSTTRLGADHDPIVIVDDWPRNIAIENGRSAVALLDVHITDHFIRAIFEGNAGGFMVRMVSGIRIPVHTRLASLVSALLATSRGLNG